ncbi:biotin synthase BioB [Treponema sp.]|uniref:biotin synthase BioB n=1 Tax=Treponema sp. TaxID=166 RepID=UPI0025DA6C8B|nr:biotin synthase BioB [Treponema sp.]MCR5217249.1 biotin synthase BioB [Treponema sp.]
MSIFNVAEEIIGGRRLGRKDNLDFLKSWDLNELCQAADKIRQHFKGEKIDLCSIISGRSGRCGENCKFCAQSAWNHTNCKEYDFLDEEEILNKARSDAGEGVHRFSIVTAGKALTGEEFSKALHAFKRIKEEVKIDLCASLGFLSREQFLQLKEAGVSRYHHNIETSRRFFPQICTSHSYQMKIDTLHLLKSCGLKICSGGIIGMGENFDDRIDMALSLSEIPVDSIPINVLTPVAGTPLENQPPLSQKDILRTVAIFRFINPQAHIRLAAGRKYLSDNGRDAFLSGADSTITGNFLTTTGSNIESDKKMFNKIKRSF